MKLQRALLSLNLGLSVAAATLPVVAAADPAALAACSSCHALTKPADTSLDRLMTRNGPDLYYAGVKFQRKWLVDWLQSPTPIRPGGVMFVRAVKAGAPGTADTVDPAKVPAHPKLGAAEAATAADALMGLAPGGLVEKGAYKQGPVNAMMSGLLFNKLRGCSSCHAIKAGSGGVSGPELYSGGDRLQPV
jgi:cytochrome c2